MSVIPAEMAKPTEVFFRVGTLVGPSNYVKDGGTDTKREGTIFLGGMTWPGIVTSSFHLRRKQITDLLEPVV